MGLFYTNMTLFRPERTAAMAELRRLKRSAFLSPSVEGHTVVFDKAIDEQDTEAIEEIGKLITKPLSCAAMTAVLHDDDVLYLWLFENGKLLDHYNSCPAYFNDSLSPEPSGGDGELVCRVFGRQDWTKQVEKLLRMDIFSPESKIPGEQERHAALAAELGMPPFVAGLGYSAIAGGYIPDEFNSTKYERV
jgi:hypothetical protein